MRTFETRAPRRSAMPTLALLAALALAGCSRGHVGESWQCPLATGGSCGSVATVDPAVPETAGRTVPEAPLWRKRDGAGDLSEATVCAGDLSEATVCAGGCGDGSGPFGWLGRLLPDSHGDADPRARDEENGPGNYVPGADAAISSAALSALPAEPAFALHEADAEDRYGDGPHGDGMRTDEVVARIWIAPFVDGNGVYREAGHVRVVLEPASWRTE